MTLQNDIISLLPDRENYIVGFADMGDLIRDHYPYRYAVVIGKKLDDAIIDDIEEGPTPVYYELYQSANNELDAISANICRLLERNNIPCLQIRATVQQTDIPAGFGKT
ncbi:MAG TPA: hypothetical protein P5238_08120, partial [Smithellaceae bacterium]|nr:hypothetical protein [Smithellaceae bacterium]